MAGGDPVTAGLVGSISRPDGNTTGFPSLLPSMGGKWLELLKEAVPRMARVALVFNPELSRGTYFDSIEAAAAQYGVTAIRTPVRNTIEIERALEAFAAEPNGGLIIVPPPLLNTDNELIKRLAVHYRLPTIWAGSRGAEEGGLISYGGNIPDLFRRGGASYVDRILRGAKINDLPVQFPTRFELVINLKTAKALGLTVPQSILLSADEVIE
jgi:putative ABC transport system substrate-binding protein